jgi:hypothetical protein
MSEDNTNGGPVNLNEGRRPTGMTPVDFGKGRQTMPITPLPSTPPQSSQNTPPPAPPAAQEKNVMDKQPPTPQRGPARADLHPLPGTLEARARGCKCSVATGADGNPLLDSSGSPLYSFSKGCPIPNQG